MEFFLRNNGAEKTDVDDVQQHSFAVVPDRVKWEIEQTPEAFYARINEISNCFTKAKYTKALAVQRLLDLMYDINNSCNGTFDIQTKSRYYLLIFNYIYRIRSAKLRIVDAVKRKFLNVDQMMYINGIDFSHLRLPGLRIANALFTHCDLSACSVQELQASSCQFVQCRFDAANLAQAELSNCSFEGVSLTGSNLSSVRVIKTAFVGCDFSEVVSSRGQHPLRLNGCNLMACSFRDADLRGADFRNSRMTGCDVLDAKKQDAKGLI